MLEAICGTLWLLLLVGAVISPPVLLLMGLRDMRAKRHARAVTRATLAGMASVVQAVLVGGIASLAIVLHHRTPTLMAAVTVPVGFWVLSRRLHRSIRMHRDEDRRKAVAERLREAESG